MGSCIDISFRRVWEKPQLTMGRVWQQPELAIGRVWEKPAVSLGRVWERPEMTTGRVWERPVITFSKVCSISDSFYITIPMEYIWLTPDNDFSENVAVYANVTWTIE